MALAPGLAMRLTSLAALACLLVACSYYRAPELAEAKILSDAPAPGAGTVRGVSVVPFQRAEESVSAGGSARIYRLFVVMDTGATHTVDVANPTFMPDERVAFTQDGRVLRLSGTTLE